MTDGLNVYVNNAQLKFMLGGCQDNLIVAGRGVAKTSGIHAWDQRRKMIYMPGSKGLFVNATYQQFKQLIIPSLIGGLRRLGVHQGTHYVIGKADKKLGFKEPIEPPSDWKNIIHFRSGRVLQLISLDIPGSANGLNSDDISGDEVKYWDYEQFENEVLPTMRANQSIFGHLFFHWSTTLTTSMPTSADAKWILKRIDEARKENCFNLKKLQYMEALNFDKLDLLSMLNKSNPTEQKKLQAKINKIDAELDPLRFDTTFTMEADTFENIAVLTERYIRRMRKIMDNHTFNTEILNLRPATVEKCFYSGLSTEKHTYPSAFNNQYLADTGLLKIKETCLQDADCLPNEPLHLCLDWGVNINSLTIGHYYTYERGHDKHLMNAINCMYTKWPDDYTNLAEMFCDYYAPHYNKNYYLHHDPKTGWERRPGNKMFPTWADEFMSILKKHGWNCIFVTKQEMPTHMSRYGMWRSVFNQTDKKFPVFTANQIKCKPLLNSMLNTPTLEDHRGISKNKSSEKSGSGVLPEEATHFGDTADIWLVDIMRGIQNNYGEFYDLNKI